MDEVRSYVRLDLPPIDGKAAQQIVPPRSRTPCWKGPGADSEEKHEPASDIDTGAMESLKRLTPNGRLEKRTLLLCRPAAINRDCSTGDVMGCGVREPQRQ